MSTFCLGSIKRHVFFFWLTLWFALGIIISSKVKFAGLTNWCSMNTEFCVSKSTMASVGVSSCKGHLKSKNASNDIHIMKRGAWLKRDKFFWMLFLQSVQFRNSARRHFYLGYRSQCLFDQLNHPILGLLKLIVYLLLYSTAIIWMSSFWVSPPDFPSKHSLFVGADIELSGDIKSKHSSKDSSCGMQAGFKGDIGSVVLAFESSLWMKIPRSLEGKLFCCILLSFFKWPICIGLTCRFEKLLHWLYTYTGRWTKMGRSMIMSYWLLNTQDSLRWHWHWPTRGYL